MSLTKKQTDRACTIARALLASVIPGDYIPARSDIVGLHDAIRWEAENMGLVVVARGWGFDILQKGQ